METHTKRKKVDFSNAIGRILGVVFIALWITSVFWVPKVFNSLKGALDESGWIEHSRDTPIWIGGEWLAGEYRVCKMPLLPGLRLPSSAHLLCGRNLQQTTDSWPVDFIEAIPDHDFYALMGTNWNAIDQNFHVLPVKYWGRINREDQLMFSWRCQRREYGLTCYAVN